MTQRKNKILLNLSRAVSAIFSAVSSALFGVAYVLFAGERLFLGDKLIMFFTFLFFLLIPILSIQVFLSLKLISDLDTRNKKERILMLTIFLLSNLILLALSFFLGYFDLFKLLILTLLPFVLLTVINKFWIISIHTSSVGVLATIATYLSGISYSFLFLIVLLVAVARVYEGKHTVLQVVGGGALGILVTLLLLLVFFPVLYLS
jgi:membrane-associated phospholipid phosphatase